MQKRYLTYSLLAAILMGSVLASGCTQKETESPETVTLPKETVAPTNWTNTELTNLHTGEKFRISDLKPRYWLLESLWERPLR